MTPRSKCIGVSLSHVLLDQNRRDFSSERSKPQNRPGGFDMDQATRINHRAPRAARLLTHLWANLPRGHTGRRGYTDTGRGYTDTGTWPRETAISRHSSCPTFDVSVWRQSSVPTSRAIIQRQSPRREILSSSSSSLMPIYLLASFIRTTLRLICNSCRVICPLPATSPRFQCGCRANEMQ